MPHPIKEKFKFPTPQAQIEVVKCLGYAQEGDVEINL